MNFENRCPLCDYGSEKLISFNWNDFIVIHCNNCGLDYCSLMVEKETGGNSSPVHMAGIEMMASSFHTTKKLAEMYANKRIDIFETYLQRKCNNILEVGCGPGVFYSPFNKKNIEWDGVDINPYWKLFGEKNNIPISDLPLDQIDKKFDVITAHQVLEHVEDPISFMKSIVSKLKPGGIIHLELPNQNSFNSRIRKISSLISYDYGFIQPPMHLRAYQKFTLETLFNKIGIQTKKVFSCANTDKIWGQVRDYNSLQSLFYTLSGKVGMGSLLIGLAKKSI
jgi:SAM-dependent methyltransferase